MDEKELFYQVLKREVDNIIGAISPAFRPFSNIVSNYIINYIDPYINAFMAGTNKINAEAAGAFVKKEVDDKVNSFLKEFNKQKSEKDV